MSAGVVVAARAGADVEALVLCLQRELGAA